jgi:large subunit ribosomal protein L29
MKLGQTEGVKKLRDLRKDIARIKTIARERELKIGGTAVSAQTEASAQTAVKPVRAARKAKTAASAKKGAR